MIMYSIDIGVVFWWLEHPFIFLSQILGVDIGLYVYSISLVIFVCMGMGGWLELG